MTWNQPNKEAIEAQVQGEQLLISALVAPEIGGTISYAKSSVISNCYNSCSISSDYGSIGGIVYRAYESKISNCFNRGNIVSETGGVGGIVKQVAWESMSQSDDPVTIQECFNSGELCGDDDVSGIANGSIIPQTAITRCYNVGGLTANRCYGIGKAFRIDNCYNAGNLSGSFLYGIGYSEDDGNISFCYNIGLLTGVANIIEYGGGETTRTEEAKVGGICDDGASVSNCYYIDTTENATPEGALFANVNKLTDAEMQDADAFQGFDFSEVWKMGDSNYPYPVFRPFGQN